MKDQFIQNAMEVRGRVAEVCEECSRDADEITIVAITKGFPPMTINTAVAAGFNNIGESRVQEANRKLLETGHIACFHMVGHLQTNKAKKAVQLFDVIQSVDSLRLAEEINRHAETANRIVECFVQVNSSGEEQKSGVEPDLCLDLIRDVNELPYINVTGLMTIGPLTEDERAINAAFSKCRELFLEGRQIVGEDFEHLSMGMSGDFHLAIAQGATMIRLGTALFGPRPA